MNKSQFNIKISKDLLTQIKRQAIMSGKSLTEHITDLITKSLAENNTRNLDANAINRLNVFEERLLNIESIVRNLEYISPNLKPFNNLEAINCTKFMKGIFDKQAESKNFKNKKDAFDDLYKHIKVYDQLSQFYFDRLETILLSDKATPWTGAELNDITGDDKCNCSIRKGLINWTGKINCPSQQ